MIRAWQRILPKNVPPSIRERGDLATLREHFLQQAILGQALVTLWFALPHLIRAVNGQPGENLGLWLFLAGTALLLPFLRDMAFGLRIALVILPPYILGIVLALQYGPLFLAPVAFLGATFLGFLLLDRGPASAWLVLNLITPSGIGLSLRLNILPTPDPEKVLLLNTTLAWLNLLVALAYFASLGALSIPFLGEYLNHLAIEKSTLERQLRSTRGEFERNLNLRTAELQRRIHELYAASTIARAINTAADQQTMLQQIADYLQQEFNFYYVGIFLIDESGKFAVLRAATGEAGQRMLAEGHRLAVGGNSMIGWATAHKEPRISQDVSLELVRFPNPYLPLTRSELALPILRRGQCLGAISVQSTHVRAFEENDVLVLQGVADSIGLALENAEFYQRVQQLREEVRALARERVAEDWGALIRAAGPIEITYQNPNAQPGEESSTNTAQFPLILRDQIIGSIALEIDKTDLTGDEIAWLDAVAMQTATALENARLFLETQQQALFEQRLNEISARLSRVESVDDILKTAVQALSEFPGITETAIQLIPPQSSASKDDER